MKKVTFYCDGPDPMKEFIDDPTLPAPLLTASWADCLLGYIRKSSNDNGGKKADAMLQALADGRTVNVRVMSEDECRAEFIKWARGAYEERQCVFDAQGVFFNFDVAVRWGAWLACARANGLVKP